MNTAAVIGLGRVGAGYERASGAPPRTHIGVLLDCGFTVAAIVDPAPDARQRALTTWPQLKYASAFASLADLPSDGVDVIVLATPPDTRLEHVVTALRCRPRVLIVEKPFALDTRAALRIADAVGKANIEVRVNFQRRFDPGHLDARRHLTTRPSKVVMSYGKGLFNYASHLIDIVIDWFGEIELVTAFGDRTAANPSFCCRMSSGFDCVVVGMDGLAYDQFDVDVFLPDVKIALHLGGCERTMREPASDRFYPGYAHLGPARQIGDLGPIGGLREFYLNVRDHLTSGAPLRGCTITEAIHGTAVLEAVERSRHTGTPVAPLASLTYELN